MFITTVRRLLISLSSLRLTLVAMLALILVIFYDLQISALHEAWIATCFGLLSLNLAAAIAVRTPFRRLPGLLIFHICLMAVAGLAAIQTLTRFEGRIELAEKQTFSIDATEVLQQGPWHLNRLDEISFVQGPVRVDYFPHLRRGRTRTEVFKAEGGGLKSVIFGDTRAFHARGYRFVTTSNKGYALNLTWLGEDMKSVSGNIHLPSYPVREWKQQNHWLTPAGEALVFELDIFPVATEENWTLSSSNFDGRVFVRPQDGSRHELNVGRALAMQDGRLRLDDIVLWIGYRIESNVVLPWLFVSAVLGTLALGWHFWQNPPEFRAAGINRNNASVS